MRTVGCGWRSAPLACRADRIHPTIWGRPGDRRPRVFRRMPGLSDDSLDAALDDASTDGVAGESGGIMDIELLHEMLAMLLHGLDADAENRCGHLVGLAFGDQLEHLHLA